MIRSDKKEFDELKIKTIEKIVKQKEKLKFKIH